jgi:signal transduction histidine kinase
MPQAFGLPVAVAARHARPRHRLRTAIAGTILAGLAVAATAIAFDRSMGEDIAPLAVMIGSGTAGILIVLGSRDYVDRERLAWRLVGSGLLVASAGVLVVALLSLIGPVPAFGPQDLIFMAAYGTTLTGFALMPHLGSAVGSRARVLLDGLIGATAMSIAVWVLFLQGLVEVLSEGTFWERFAGVAYPILDISAVVVALIVTIRRSSWRFDPRIVLLGMAMVVQAGGDLSLLSTGINRAFSEAQPLFVLFVLAQCGYLGVGMVIHIRPAPREYADRRQALWPMLAPYGAVGLVGVVLVVKLASAHLSSETRVLLLLAATLVMMVIARQAVALREYRRVVEDRRKSLVSSVSHELRTPLTAMVGFLDVMKDPAMQMAEEERRELTQVVHQQAIYMSRIVADLLLLARDSEGPELHESVVPIDRIVSDSVLLGRITPNGHETEIEPGLYAYLDPDRIHQVIDNLVTNAMRYGRGRVLVTIAAHAQDLVLEVHDDGPGVPRKYELVIWEQFERGPNRLNSNVPGSGIGLAVVDRIVRRHGGSVGYEHSRRLDGACFRVVLSGRVRPAPVSEPVREGLQRPVPAR